MGLAPWSLDFAYPMFRIWSRNQIALDMNLIDWWIETLRAASKYGKVPQSFRIDGVSNPIGL